MVSMRNLTPSDLVAIAKQLVAKGFHKNTSTCAVLVTTSEYIEGSGEKVVNQAIVLCTEVES